MSGFLFLLIIDWVMRHTQKEEGTGLRWKFTSKLEDLDFADIVAIISSTQRHVQLKTNRLLENAEKIRPSGKYREVQSHESQCKE